MIKTQGFDSQQDFELMQHSHIKSSRKILGSLERDKPAVLKVDEMLFKLVEYERILNKREEQLVVKEQQMDNLKTTSTQCTGLLEQFA